MKAVPGGHNLFVPGKKETTMTYNLFAKIYEVVFSVLLIKSTCEVLKEGGETPCRNDKKAVFLYLFFLRTSRSWMKIEIKN